MKKKIPNFKNKEEERLFWEKNDSAEYLDWNKAVKNPAFVNLKPSTKTISLRMSESMLAALKMRAHAQDVPYQSYIKTILSKELGG